jgi:putative OPT family oligopeptide transporter
MKPVSMSYVFVIDVPEKMTKHKPHVSSSITLPEFTVKAVVLGVISGMIFGAANAYLGLRAGLTVSTSIPIAVITIAVFRLLKPIIGRASILENNISQTIGSASSSLASGVIFTIPALFLWHLDPTILQMATLACLGGLLGVLFMIPLRKPLIVKEHGRLPYPEGTACAEVLIAGETGGTRAKNVFLGLIIGGIYKFFVGFLHLWKDRVFIKIPGFPKAAIGIEPTPALLGVGYILGHRIAAIMVAGSAISWLVLIPLIAHFGAGLDLPLFPETENRIADMTPSEIWTRYIRYIGAGAVAFGGIITIIKAVPTIFESIGLGIREMKKRFQKVVIEKIRTEHDIPILYVLFGALTIVLIIACVPNIIGAVESFGMRFMGAICIAFFSFLFVTVSSRIVGLVGVSSNPTSGMTIVTLLGTSLMFVLMGWSDEIGKAACLMVGTIVCISASIAGDTSQDLKTGFLIGATPHKQQIGELIGVLTSVFAVCVTVMVLGKAFTFGSSDLPAPQATLMKTIIEGVLSRDIPWSLVLIGMALAGIIELCSVPSLPFAVGVYLPLSTMTPIYVGGCIRYFIELLAKDDTTKIKLQCEKGILFGSGLIAGEGLIGVGIAAYVFFMGKPEGIGLTWPEPFGDIISLCVFALLGYILVRSTRTKGQ